MLRFVVESAVPGRPLWRLVGSDSVVLAWSGTTYASLAIADHAAHLFRSDPDGFEYRLQERGDTSWRWTAWDRTGERVAVAADWFVTRLEAGDPARLMRHAARIAIGP